MVGVVAPVLLVSRPVARRALTGLIARRLAGRVRLGVRHLPSNSSPFFTSLARDASHAFCAFSSISSSNQVHLNRVTFASPATNRVPGQRFSQ